MNITFRLAARALGAAAIALGVPLAHATPASLNEPLTGRLIVKYRDAAVGTQALRDAPQARRLSMASERMKTGVVADRELALGAWVLKLERTVTMSEARTLAARLAQDPRVEYAVPDVWVKPSQVSLNDPFFKYQWALMDRADTRMGGSNALAAWSFSRGAGVTVAVIDTGRVNHPDLVGQEVGGYDFVSPDSGGTFKMAGDGNGRDVDPLDPGDYCEAEGTASSWHGLRVASVIGALPNNSYGVAGLAPDSKVLHVRTLGRCGGYLSDTVDGALWAAGLDVTGMPKNPNPARVLNMSLGAAPTVACGAYEQAAFDRLKAAGVVVVVAAGNDSANALGTPAACKNVIVVGAHTQSGDLAVYSNYAPGVTLTAPGGGDCTSQVDTCRNGAVAVVGNDGSFTPGNPKEGVTFVGTSAATPHVAAAAALVLSLSPKLTPDEVRSVLVSTAAKHPSDSFCAKNTTACGAGMLDVGAALSALGTPKITFSQSATKLVGSASASASATVSGGTSPYTYAWKQLSGTDVTLADADKATVRFTAPAKRTTVKLELTVTASGGAAAKDSVVFEVNNAPVVTMPATTYALVKQPIKIALKGTDPDEDAVSFRLIDAPSGYSVSGTDLVGPAESTTKVVPVKVQAFDAFGGTSETLTLNVAVVTEIPLVQEDNGGGGAMPLWSLGLLAAAAALTRRSRQRR